MQAQMIDTGQVRLHVVTAGEGPPVVLLHGFPSYWECWQKQIEFLAAAGYKVIVPDLRGYNLSEKPHGVRRYTMDEVAGDIVGLLRALGYPSATIVGHDWGAVVAWTLAITWPDVVERLVVMNVTHPSITRRKLFKPARMLKWWYMFFFQLPWLPERVMRMPSSIVSAFTSLTPVPGGVPRDVIRAHVNAFRQPGVATAAINYYRAALRFPSQRGMARSYVKMPTLVLWGDDDPILGKDLLDGIDSVGSDVTVHYLPCGHWLQLEMPDRVNEELAAFLSRNVSELPK